MGNSKQVPLNGKVKQSTETKIPDISIDGLKASMETLKTINSKAVELCEICAGEPNAVLMECGHGGFCSKCAQNAVRDNKTCPVCNNAITLVLIIDTTSPKNNFVKVIGSIEIEEPKKLCSTVV